MKAKTRQGIQWLVAVCLCLLMVGCVSNKEKSPQERRQDIMTMRSNVLKELYKLDPDARSKIAASSGYAVFSNANVNVLFASFGGGYGVVENKRTKKSVYMKMGEAGIGLGLGVKDFRAVFVFKTQESLDAFINNGWEFGGHADAAAKSGDKGAAVGGEALLNGVTIYQITETGLVLQATLKGTKFWKDDELNK